MAGKITDVVRATSEGFARGHFSVEGLQENRGQLMTIQFQNENLVAHVDGRLVLSVPDLICCLATDGAPTAFCLRALQNDMQFHAYGSLALHTCTFSPSWKSCLSVHSKERDGTAMVLCIATYSVNSACDCQSCLMPLCCRRGF